MWKESKDPAELRILLSTEEYEDQAVDYTKLQLESLRSFLRDNPDACMSTHPSTEVLVRRFRAGKPHYRAQEAEESSTPFFARLMQTAATTMMVLTTLAFATASLLVLAALYGVERMPVELQDILQASGMYHVVNDLGKALLGNDN